jgi:hypothetical protein
MADTAAHLVDRVFPRVPVRQWVLSFPHDLRYRLAYDSSLVTDVLGIFTYAASVRGRVANGANSGRRVIRAGDQIEPESMEAFPSPRCATVDGFSLHANVAVAAGDRARLERLAQYCARGPIAMDRLEVAADGRLLYRFKRRWRDGTTHIIVTPLEMLEKLSALIPHHMRIWYDMRACWRLRPNGDPRSYRPYQYQ